MRAQPFFYLSWLVALTMMAAPELQAADPPVEDKIRSGHASSIAPWAQPGITRHYSGGFLGGGAARRGAGRTQVQGTWCWDFHGLLPRKNIWLGWWNGRRDQGGRGAYKTEGPRIRNHGHGHDDGH